MTPATAPIPPAAAGTPNPARRKRGSDGQLASSPAMPGTPFDAAAGSYDADFTGTLLARWLREAVWSVLADTFVPGDRVLELGCGTGEDAVWLAQRGIHVTATDASLAMLDTAQRKAMAAGVSELIDFAAFDLAAAASDRLPFTDHRLPFTGAFSNFGPLNCLPRSPATGLAGCGPAARWCWWSWGRSARGRSAGT
ncbi:MAG: class I SAM-dependent methyltransferase [Caldilineae bacterium]|nr:class I SAM-dependent methyltransferase [Caldilineae bacterium]